MVSEEKAALRRSLSARLTSIPLAERQRSDTLLFQNLSSLPVWQNAQIIFSFCGVNTEPNTALLHDNLLSSGKQLALPRWFADGRMDACLVQTLNSLLPGQNGIPTPAPESPIIPPEQIDLILVPALCYDRCGFRLGHGGGYYDRYLASFQGLTVGLCRDMVLQERLPREAHDRSVLLVITETALFENPTCK